VVLKSYIYPTLGRFGLLDNKQTNMGKSIMADIKKYEFTFTASSLRLNEMVLVANAILDERAIDYVNELGNGKATTGKRMLFELQKRIATLSPQALDLLANGPLSTQKQISFLAVCKAYSYICDFVVEVLREKLLLFDVEITEGDYISFYRRKAAQHPELEALTEITRYKIRQVTFKILEQAGLIDSIKTKIIQPQLLERHLLEAVVSDDPKWLKIFLMSDTDIANVIK
jgi:hypothetical protein